MTTTYKPVTAVLFDMDGLLLSKISKSGASMTDLIDFLRNNFRHGTDLREGFQRVVREIWKETDTGSSSETPRIDRETFM